MEEIKEILSKTFRVKFEDIKENTTINDIDTWDSLTHMELVANLEEGLDIELDGEEIMQMTSVEFIKNIVEEKRK